MPLSIKASFDKKQLSALKPSKLKRGMSKTLRKASATSLRDMKSEASKRIRKRKRLKVKAVKAATVPVKNTGRALDDMKWGIRMRGAPVKLSAYPHRALRRGGVSVAVNKGKRTVLKKAFMATTRSGHKGVFRRLSKRRLPIREPLASRPADALLHKGEAEGVRERGRVSFLKTVERLLAAELSKS